jgi:DNA-binding transcriptional MerR regulator
MVVYSIKELESASGVKAHTIRIWEKRFNLFNPERNDGNRRRYKEDDLHKLVQIAFLIKNGYKISKIASFSPPEIDHLTLELKGMGHDFDSKKEMMMLSILDLDENRYKKILDSCTRDNGLEFALEKMIFPLLNKINILKISGTFKKVHECFIVHHTKRKIIQASEELESKINHHSSCILLYLPKEGHEELTSLYLQYLAKKWKIKLVSLGTEIDLTDLKDASVICRPGYILSFYNPAFSNKSFGEFVKQFKADAFNQKIVVYIPGDFNLQEEYVDDVKILKGKTQFESFLKQLQEKKR